MARDCKSIHAASAAFRTHTLLSWNAAPPTGATASAAVAPIGGAAFPDNKVWVKKAAASALLNS